MESGNTKQLSNKERYGADKNKLVPTDIGKVVTDFLVENFEKIQKEYVTELAQDAKKNGIIKDWVLLKPIRNLE